MFPNHPNLTLVSGLLLYFDGDSDKVELKLRMKLFEAQLLGLKLYPEVFKTEVTTPARNDDPFSKLKQAHNASKSRYASKTLVRRFMTLYDVL